MQTIQLTAQVDADGMLRVQMPDGLKNATVEATIVFTATSNSKVERVDKSNPLSLENSVADDPVSWQELIHSLAGAWIH